MALAEEDTAGKLLSQSSKASSYNCTNTRKFVLLLILFTMIDLYTWKTPNGYKISILLEELGWDYKLIPVNIGKGEQFDPEFLRISPNNKIPAIVDRDTEDLIPYPVFESGAILMYLAEKAGRFFPSPVKQRYEVIQWLMFQVGSIGPMLGQAYHFKYASESIPYAIQRYSDEALRLYKVMEKRLGEESFLAGDYSIADIALFPWVDAYSQNLEIDTFPHVKRWLGQIGDREAVKKGMSILKNE